MEIVKIRQKHENFMKNTKITSFLQNVTDKPDVWEMSFFD